MITPAADPRYILITVSLLSSNQCKRIIEPRANIDPIQLAASKVTFPLANGESSESKTSKDGDIHPAAQPCASNKTLAENCEQIVGHFRSERLF